MDSCWVVQSLILRWKETFNLEINTLRSGGRVKRFTEFKVFAVQSVMICGVMSSAIIGPLCFIKSKVNTASTWRFQSFMLPSTDKLYRDADFIFQQELAAVHRAKTPNKWFSDYITVLDWQDNSLELAVAH